MTGTVLLLAASVSAQIAPVAADAGPGRGTWLDNAAQAAGFAAPDRSTLAPRTPSLHGPSYRGLDLSAAASGAVPFMLVSDQGGPAADEQVAAGLRPPIDKTSDAVLQITSSGHLNDLFQRMDFSLDAVRDDAPVPRIFIAELPEDMRALDDSGLRKELFFGTLLPLVLRVNESILHDRARLLELRHRIVHRQPLGPRDRAWLAGLAGQYGVAEDDLNGLLQRVDIIPPSMALAQAAVESGWGTSSLARRGNAVFGQTGSSGSGSVRGKGGERFAAFDRLIDSAEAYALNLNSNSAYRAFRTLRAEARAAGRTPDGYALLAGIDNYSTLGRDYINYVRRVIRANDLQALDDARLAPAPGAERPEGSPI